MHIAISILILLISLLFIPVVLIQNPNASYRPAVQALGAARAIGLIEKTTWALGSLMLVLSVCAACIR